MISWGGFNFKILNTKTFIGLYLFHDWVRTTFSYYAPDYTFSLFVASLWNYDIDRTLLTKNQLIEFIVWFWPVFGQRYRVHDLDHISVLELKDLLNSIATQQHRFPKTYFNYKLTTGQVKLINSIPWLMKE